MNFENRCVHCGEDTSFGSGRFVNRVPADSDCEALNKDGKIIFEAGEYRDGYSCAKCMAMECDRCGEMIPFDEDITCYDLQKTSWTTYDGLKDEFEDGSSRVHEHCLTAEEING